MIKALINRFKKVGNYSSNKLFTDSYTRSKILKTLLIIIKNNPNLSDFLNKIEFSIDNHMYPETKCLWYEVISKYQFGDIKTSFNFEFIEKSMRPITDRQTA